MRIICAPDSYKESLSAVKAAEAMSAGVREAGAEPDVCPIADGGEGTLDALIGAMGGTIHTATVTGPLVEPVEARYGISSDGRTGIVELPQASGLALVPRDRRDPTRTTTYGTGELIRLSHEAGCDTVIVGIGGSATVDGAAGLTQALGGRFFDESGELITDPITGGMLHRISRFDPPPSLPRIRIACDVTNPLCGPNGAAAVYGPQKGATPEQVKLLDAALAHLAEICGVPGDFPGAGSAGGAGYGLIVMCNGKLERGIDLVLDAISFEQRCRGASIVLTGEGRLDSQSLSGKATVGVAKAAAKLGVTTVAIVGSLGEGGDACLESNGGAIQRCISLAERFGMDRAMGEAAACITEIACEVTAALRE